MGVVDEGVYALVVLLCLTFGEIELWHIPLWMTLGLAPYSSAVWKPVAYAVLAGCITLALVFLYLDVNTNLHIYIAAVLLCFVIPCT